MKWLCERQHALYETTSRDRLRGAAARAVECAWKVSGYMQSESFGDMPQQVEALGHHFVVQTTEKWQHERCREFVACV